MKEDLYLRVYQLPSVISELIFRQIQLELQPVKYKSHLIISRHVQIIITVVEERFKMKN